MKHVILLSFVIIAFGCGITKSGSSQYNSNSTEQIFISKKGNGPGGKCYSKMMLGTETVWTEVVCQRQFSKGLIKQIQSDLVRLNYVLAGNEISKAKYGKTTRQAIKDFQIKNNMAYGGLDWATVNRLKGL